MNRPLTDRDRAFLAKMKKLGDRPERGVTGGVKMIEVDVDVLHVGERSVRVFDGKKTIYLPTSACTIEGNKVLVAEWLAVKEGLI